MHGLRSFARMLSSRFVWGGLGGGGGSGGGGGISAAGAGGEGGTNVGDTKNSDL